MQHEPQKSATPSASPKPGLPHPSSPPARPVTRRELRLAAERAAAAEAASGASAGPGAPAGPVGATSPTAPVVTRRMLREAAARAAADEARVPADDVVQAPAPLLAPLQAPTVLALPAAPAADPAPVATVVDVAAAHRVTRRELRLGADAACPPPFALLDPPRASHPAAPGRRSRGVRVARSATTLALSAAIAVSGFALQDGVHGLRGTASDADAARQQAERTARAESARLGAQADAWAAGQRTQALQVAAAALEQADAAVEVAAPLVQPDAVAPLDQAVADLEAMVGAAEPAPGTPAPVEARLRDGAVERTSRAAGARGAVPTQEPTEEPTHEASQEPVEGGAGGQADGATAEEPAADATDVLPATDLASTQEMFQVAEQVAALTAQVQAATEARIAEEAARAVAEAAAAEMARKVAIAEDAPNGEIPTDVLCAPAFAADELLRCDAVEALERLNEAYRAEFGRDLSVVSSYRSYGMQVATRRSRGGLAATPGTSNHGRAVAVDFGDFGHLGSFRDADYLWMKQNGPAFGWYHPEIMEPGGGGPQEPWHWEYGTDTGWDSPNR